MIPLLAIKVEFRCKWCKFHLCLSCGLQVRLIIKDPDVNCLEGDFHSNMCSLLLWHFQFRANRSARRALFISTVTFKNTQLLEKKLCSPESTRELPGSQDLALPHCFLCIHHLSDIIHSAAITSFFRSKVNMSKWSLKIYFPECFHTLVWLRWDFN